MRKLYFMLCLITIFFVIGCKKTDVPVEDETILTNKETEKENNIQTEEDVKREENETIDNTLETVTNIDWSDFIKYFDQVYENSKKVVPEEEIGSEIGEITGNPPSKIEGTEYITQNGEAGWMPVGTKLYNIKKLDQLNYIAAFFEGQYIFYKTEDSEQVSFKNPEEKKPPKKVTKDDRIYLTKEAGYESIYKLPKEYTINMATEKEDYIDLYDSSLNSEKMIDFLANAGDKEAAMVRKVTTTIEGDVIIIDYIFNGESFRVVMDNTRDKFAEKPQRIEKNFAYALVCEEENGKYIVLTNGRSQEELQESVVLLNEHETEELDGVHLLKTKEKS